MEQPKSETAKMLEFIIFATFIVAIVSVAIFLSSREVPTAPPVVRVRKPRHPKTPEVVGISQQDLDRAFEQGIREGITLAHQIMSSHKRLPVYEGEDNELVVGIEHKDGEEYIFTPLAVINGQSVTSLIRRRTA